jgi:hypothetical protein
MPMVVAVAAAALVVASGIAIVHIASSLPLDDAKSLVVDVKMGVFAHLGSPMPE